MIFKIKRRNYPFINNEVYDLRFRMGWGYFFNDYDKRYGFYRQNVPWENTIRLGLGRYFIFVGWVG